MIPLYLSPLATRSLPGCDALVYGYLHFATHTIIGAYSERVSIIFWRPTSLLSSRRYGWVDGG